MKVVKILLKVVLWLLALVLLALLTVPLWFGPVVKAFANAVAPGIVKTDFHIGHLSLNPYTARFELGDLKLSNPAGYAEKYAVTVGDIAFDAETLSLPTDVIRIEEITIRDVFVSYVSGGEGKVNNFEQIQYNVAGGKEKYEAAKAAKAELEKAAKAEPSEQATDRRPAAEKPSKKFVIGRLELSGLTVKVGILPIKLPCGLVLKDIGRESQGATMEEIFQQIWTEVQKAAGNVGDMMKTFGGKTGEAASKTVDTVKDLGKDTVKDVGGTVKATGKLGKEAVKDVGEGAKKALDSLKGLW